MANGKGRKKGEGVKILALAIIFGLMIFSGLSAVFINLSGNNAAQNYLNTEEANVNNQSTSSVPCLVPGVAVLQSFETRLAILVDGQRQNIPKGIGINGSCTGELSTIDGNGIISVKAQNDRKYTLGDFFAVWGVSMEQPGYSLTMTVNGKPSTELGNLVLAKNQQIILSYSSSTPK
ncbi:MAG: hypothetical protein M1153_02120 [Patescibacteria group bacterium]|nr:hypothetical protein [Patescibacteria group bacterium]